MRFPVPSHLKIQRKRTPFIILCSSCLIYVMRGGFFGPVTYSTVLESAQSFKNNIRLLSLSFFLDSYYVCVYTEVSVSHLPQKWVHKRKVWVPPACLLAWLLSTFWKMMTLTRRSGPTSARESWRECTEGEWISLNVYYK